MAPISNDNSELCSASHGYTARAFRLITHSGSLSTMEAAGERGNGDILGEGGVPAGLELGVVGDCIFSHCTMDGRVWLGVVAVASPQLPPSAARWFPSSPGGPWAADVVGDGVERES